MKSGIITARCGAALLTAAYFFILMMTMNSFASGFLRIQPFPPCDNRIFIGSDGSSSIRSKLTYYFRSGSSMSNRDAAAGGLANEAVTETEVNCTIFEQNDTSAAITSSAVVDAAAPVRRQSFGFFGAMARILIPWWLRGPAVRAERERRKLQRKQQREDMLKEKQRKKQLKEEKRLRKKQEARARGWLGGMFSRKVNTTVATNDFETFLNNDYNQTDDENRATEVVEALLKQDDEMLEEEPDRFEELLFREIPLGVLEVDLSEDEQMIADYEAAHDDLFLLTNASSGSILSEVILSAVTGDNLDAANNTIATTPGNDSNMNNTIIEALSTSPDIPSTKSKAVSASKYGLIPMLRGVHDQIQAGNLMSNHSADFHWIGPVTKFPVTSRQQLNLSSNDSRSILRELASINSRLTKVEKGLQQYATVKSSKSSNSIEAASFTTKGAGKNFVNAISEYQNTFAISPKNVRRCAIGSFFLFGSLLCFTVERRLWLVGGLVGALWASGAVRRNSRSGALARRVGVEVAQQIKDMQEKYNQFMIFYRTGKLAYMSSKTWDYYDREWGITERFDALKKVTRDRAAAFNSTFAGTGVGEMWEILRQTPSNARRMDEKYGITSTIISSTNAVLGTSLSTLGALIGLEKPKSAKKRPSNVRRGGSGRGEDAGLVVRAWDALFGSGTRRTTRGYAHVDPWALPWSSKSGRRTSGDNGDRDRLIYMLMLVILVQTFKDVIIAAMRGNAGATIITTAATLPPSRRQFQGF